MSDLSLAYGIRGTRWQRAGRRLGARDLPAFHRALGTTRPRSGGRLSCPRLLDGAARLLGDWFPEAWADPTRRAHGIAFPTAAERTLFDPARRVRHAGLREPTPPRRPAPERHWATYPAVALPEPDAAPELLLDPARWPDFGSPGPHAAGGARSSAARSPTSRPPTRISSCPRRTTAPRSCAHSRD